MNYKHFGYIFVLVIAIFLLTSTQASQSLTPSANADAPALSQTEAIIALQEKIEAEGEGRVIVGLALPQPFAPEGDLSGPGLLSQRNLIQETQENLLAELAPYQAESYAVYRTIPVIALLVDTAAFAALQRSPWVNHIQEDEAVSHALTNSTVVIGAPTAWSSGYDGTGQAVVILDTGIDNNHPFFEDDEGNSRIVAEACFSNDFGNADRDPLCPNGTISQIGPGSAEANINRCQRNWPNSNDGGQICDHGTHVAGIAAGYSDSMKGVAPNADIIAIQVFHRLTPCPVSGSCVRAWNTDLLLALEHIYDTLRHTHDVAAINMSLGGGQHTSPCDNDSRKPIIDNLRSVDIASVIATGNNGWTDAIGGPACISTAVAVGSTTNNDTVSSFSNVHEMMDLFAPGSAISSAIVGGGFASFNGTSMATPHVAGAWAVLKQFYPNASVDLVLDTLVDTGVLVTDGRTGGTVTKPRIQLDAALANLAPNVWEGNSSNDWHEAANWSRDAVPTCIEQAVIPEVVNPPLITADATAANLIMEEGATLSMADHTLTLCGYLEAAETAVFTMNGGTLVLTATSQITITLPSPDNQLHHVEVGDGVNGKSVTLDSDITINGNLTIRDQATLAAGHHTIHLAGNWLDEGHGFVPATSTVVFTGTTQTAHKITTSVLLEEDFNAYASCGCTTAPPAGWSRQQTDGYGFVFGKLSNAPDGSAILWHDTFSPEAGWLFSPALYLEPGVEYELQFDTAKSLASGNFLVDVFLGEQAEIANMNTQLGSAPDPTGAYTYQTITVTFTVGTPGTYYLGWRGEKVDANYGLIDNVVLTGTQPLTFYNLEIGSSDGMNLGVDTAVLNDLTIVSQGRLHLNGYGLTVEEGLTNNGILQDTLDVPAATTTYFLHIQNKAGDTTKYRGVTITPANNMGTTAVQIGGNQYCTSDETAPFFRRCFDIEPTLPQTADIRVWLTEAERNDQPSDQVQLWRWDDAQWVEASSVQTYLHSENDAFCNSIDGNQCWLEAEAVTDYSPFVVGQAVTPTYLLQINLSPMTGGSVEISPDKAAYDPGETVTLTATTNSGWTFAHWSGDTVSSDNPLTITMSNHTVLTATFTQDSYDLSVSIVGAGDVAVVPEQSSYTYGQTITLTATADPGWTFADWSGDVVSSSNPLTLTITNDTNLTATFTQDSYDLSVSTVGEGNVEVVPDQSSYTYGQTITLTATADSGWDFVNWSGDATGGSNPLVVTITDDITITANFAQGSHMLTVNIMGEGQVEREPEQATYLTGQTITVTATADPGWAFTDWSGDVAGSSNPITFTITNDTMITATFTQENYSLLVNIIGEGDVALSPDQSSYTYGQTITLTATADPGWAFTDWSGDVTGSSNPITFTITNDTMITATFTQESYSLLVNIIGEGDVALSPDQSSYTYGQTITLTATADSGWTFTDWSGDVVDNSNPLTITITGNTVLTATFVPQERPTYTAYIPFIGRD